MKMSVDHAAQAQSERPEWANVRAHEDRRRQRRRSRDCPRSAHQSATTRLGVRSAAQRDKASSLQAAVFTSGRRRGAGGGGAGVVLAVLRGDDAEAAGDEEQDETQRDRAAGRLDPQHRPVVLRVLGVVELGEDGGAEQRAHRRVEPQHKGQRHRAPGPLLRPELRDEEVAQRQLVEGLLQARQPARPQQHLPLVGVGRPQVGADEPGGVQREQPLDPLAPRDPAPQRVRHQPDPVPHRVQHAEVGPGRPQHLHGELCREPVAEVGAQHPRHGDTQHEQPPPRPEARRRPGQLHPQPASCHRPPPSRPTLALA